MKNLIGLYFASLTLVFLFSCNPTTMKNEKEVPPIIGTWEYTGNVRGLAIVTENNFIFFATFKPDSLFSDSLNAEEILDRYNTMNVLVGTNIIEDSLVTCTNKYSKDPNFVGATWKYTYSVSGDSLHWKVIDDNGKVTNEGDSKRVKNWY